MENIEELEIQKLKLEIVLLELQIEHFRKESKLRFL